MQSTNHIALPENVQQNSNTRNTFKLNFLLLFVVVSKSHRGRSIVGALIETNSQGKSHCSIAWRFLVACVVFSEFSVSFKQRFLYSAVSMINLPLTGEKSSYDRSSGLSSLCWPYIRKILEKTSSQGEFHC